MIEVKPISYNQIPDVVSIHKNTFEGFFLTDLGDRFLTQYYLSVLYNKDGIILGSFEKDVLVGFCAATTKSKNFNINLVLLKPFNYALIALKILFTNPTSLYRLFRNLSKKNPNINDDGDYSEILSIAVDVRYQGNGIGKMLIFELEKILINYSCSKLSLTTDANNNEKTTMFYNNIGFLVLYDFLAWPNRKMYRLIKQLY